MARGETSDLHAAEHKKAREGVKDVEVVHKLVRIHPRTGRKCLYISEGAIREIVGLDRQESEDLIQELFAHLIRPEVVYRHRWKVGDVVMWDNYSAVHCATGGFDLPLRRRMHRTTLASPKSISA
jgi:taurine dioxygenase